MMADAQIRYDILSSNDATQAAWDLRSELQLSNHWTDLMLEEHASAFTVARIAKTELLRSIQTSLEEVIKNGGTYEQWHANILPELKKQGWWGIVTNTEITGSDQPVIVNERRLENIYRTNVKMSMAAGRWRRIQAQKQELPFLRYLSDHYRKHPRQDHKSWHGLILHVDDPAWQWLFPPNGWGCQCKVQQITQSMMDRKGWKLGTSPKPAMREFIRQGTGELLQIPAGIDPGFGYNPGIAHLRALAEKTTVTIEESLAVGQKKIAAELLDEFIASPALDQFIVLPQGIIPLQILPEKIAQDIAAPSPLLVINSGIAAKQSRNHPDLSSADYRSAIDLLLHHSVRLKQKDGALVIFGERPHLQPGKLWKAVVQKGGSERHPVLLSFQRTDQRELRRKLSEEGIEILQDSR